MKRKLEQALLCAAQFSAALQVPDDQVCAGFFPICGVMMEGNILLSLCVGQPSPQEKKMSVRCQ